MSGGNRTVRMTARLTEGRVCSRPIQMSLRIHCEHGCAISSWWPQAWARRRQLRPDQLVISSDINCLASTGSRLL